MSTASQLGGGAAALPGAGAPHPGAELVARLRAEAVPVGGARAVGVGLDFLRDPILAIARCHERWGPAVELSMTGPGRRAWRTLLLGPRYNREVLSRPDCARPAGLWNVSGPPGSAQAGMRRNYLATFGPEHAQLVRTVAPALNRDRTLDYFEAVRDGVLHGVSQWRAGASVDLFPAQTASLMPMPRASNAIGNHRRAASNQ